MKRTIIFYGISLAFLVFILKQLEYRFFVHDLSIDFYVTLIAFFFTALGVWVGYKLTQKPLVRLQTTPFHFSAEQLGRIGISKREHEVLLLLSMGLSNQEIADQLFVSLNTIKTHCSNLFIKLDVGRRTQAIKKGKELGLIS